MLVYPVRFDVPAPPGADALVLRVQIILQAVEAPSGMNGSLKVVCIRRRDASDSVFPGVGLISFDQTEQVTKGLVKPSPKQFFLTVFGWREGEDLVAVILGEFLTKNAPEFCQEAGGRLSAYLRRAKSS